MGRIIDAEYFRKFYEDEDFWANHFVEDYEANPYDDRTGEWSMKGAVLRGFPYMGRVEALRASSTINTMLGGLPSALFRSPGRSASPAMAASPDFSTSRRVISGIIMSSPLEVPGSSRFRKQPLL